jgi:predicted nuclease of restriction endonuclease-like (RecB) superfamily
MKIKPIYPPDYKAFIEGLKARIQSAHISAARSVNRDHILLYWDIGRQITEKQEKCGWGESVVAIISRDLRQAFPNTQGFSVQNLWRMRQLYLVLSSAEFLMQIAQEIESQRSLQPKLTNQDQQKNGSYDNQSEILSQAVRDLIVQVPWGHHVNVLSKIKDPAARLYYLRATAHYGWSRNVLLNQIKARAYQRSLAEGKLHNFPSVLPHYLAEQAEEMLKSSYSLEFLGITREVKERELEDRLIDQIQQFILELGYGFCFIGRQYRLVLGLKEYFIDLLFYHRFLKALVAVELKVGPFEPEYAGKMDFYLNLLNEKERGPDDSPSIGIILCAEKDSLEVEFALKTKKNPIGVAEYCLLSDLPKDLHGKLPTARQLSSVVHNVLPKKRNTLQKNHQNGNLLQQTLGTERRRKK